MRAVQVNCGRWLPLSVWARFATSNPAAQSYIETSRSNGISVSAKLSITSIMSTTSITLRPQPVVSGEITGKKPRVANERQIQAKNQGQSNLIVPNRA